MRENILFQIDARLFSSPVLFPSRRPCNNRHSVSRWPRPGGGALCEISACTVLNTENDDKSFQSRITVLFKPPSPCFIYLFFRLHITTSPKFHRDYLSREKKEKKLSAREREFTSFWRDRHRRVTSARFGVLTDWSIGVSTRESFLK